MDSFEEALEAIFEERAQEFGPGLRRLLRALYDEGVKDGRHQERSLSYDPRALHEVSQVGFLDPATITSAADRAPLETSGIDADTGFLKFVAETDFLKWKAGQESRRCLLCAQEYPSGDVCSCQDTGALKLMLRCLLCGRDYPSGTMCACQLTP